LIDDTQQEPEQELAPATVLVPMVRAELAELPRPARSLLGVTAKRAEPVLADGWRWVAWRSEARAWRTKLGDRPAGWLSRELWSVRLAGPWSDGPGSERWRAVALWSRPLVHLVKAKPNKRTGRRPVATAVWSSEAWLWRAGREGAVPREYGLGDVEHLARTGRPTPELWAAMATPWAEAAMFEAARQRLVVELNAGAPEYEPATRKGSR
jgi:hypothetical protein